MSSATTPRAADNPRDVEVTLTNMVAAELIARGGIMPRNASAGSD
jgi:hypothetical protein